MNLRQTAEVAALVATSASHVIEGPEQIPTESLHGYWKQSRLRLKCWFAGLQAAKLARADEDVADVSKEQLIGLCREILVTEMLTRVWSSVLAAADRQRRTTDMRAAIDSVYRGHLEARYEVLQLLAVDSHLSMADQVSLDRFRRRIERWTDALLGPLLGRYGIAEFVFDQNRAREFSDSSLQGDLKVAAESTMPLLLAGVSSAVPAACDADRERAMLNRAIVRSILMAFPAGAFGNDGRLRSAVSGRIERSSRHPETPGDRKSGLSFVELRRREQQGPGSAD